VAVEGQLEELEALNLVLLSTREVAEVLALLTIKHLSHYQQAHTMFL
jgi:hypothetical protein